MIFKQRRAHVLLQHLYIQLHNSVVFLVFCYHTCVKAILQAVMGFLGGVPEDPTPRSRCSYPAGSGAGLSAGRQ